MRFGQLLEQSNKKVAVGTYENALDDLRKQDRKEESLLVLRRIVSLEPTPANHLRLAELSAELGEHVMAAESFLKLAELAETAGDNAGRYYERAYAENPSDEKVAMAYGKSLLTQGDAGAAIFIFEPLVNGGRDLVRNCGTFMRRRCWRRSVASRLSRWCGRCSSGTRRAFIRS